MSRRLVLDLSCLSSPDLTRFDETLRFLSSARRRRASFSQGHLVLSAEEAPGSIGIGYQLLPAGTQWLARYRRGIPSLSRSIIEAMASPDTTRASDHDSLDDRSDWYAGWDRIRELVQAWRPELLPLMYSAHAGSPWRNAVCVGQDDQPILPQALVDHAFASAPHIMEFTTWDFPNGDGERFLTRHEGSLGFDDDPLDPISVMRTWANAPENVRTAA